MNLFFNSNSSNSLNNSKMNELNQHDENSGSNNLPDTPHEQASSVAVSSLAISSRRDSVRVNESSFSFKKVLQKIFALHLDEHKPERFSTSYFVPSLVLVSMRAICLVYIALIFLLETVRLGIRHVSFGDWYSQFWNLYWIGLLLYFAGATCYSISWEHATRTGLPNRLSKLLWSPVCCAVQHYLYITVVCFPFALLLQLLVIQACLVNGSYLQVSVDATSENAALERIHALVQWSYLILPFVFSILEIVFSRIKLFLSQLPQLLCTLWLYLIGQVIVLHVTLTKQQRDALFGSSSSGKDFLIVFFSSTGFCVAFFLLLYLLHLAREALGIQHGLYQQATPMKFYTNQPRVNQRTSSLYN